MDEETSSPSSTGAAAELELTEPSPTEDVGSDAAPASLTRAERRAAKRSSKRWWLRGVVALIALLLIAAGILAATGPHVTPASYHPVPGALVATQTTGSPPNVNWPAQGQGAWEIPAFNAGAASPNQTALPIGSTAKMMTALVVIDAHPLRPGESGPSLTVTAEDDDEYVFEVKDGQSRADVEVGEQLSELQLLQGLLVHSANNYALMLARWTAGSEEAFVVKMNEKAAQLGLTTTHYADASGFNPATVSTAAEQIKVAKELMASQVLAPIVKMTSVTLPVAGTLDTFTPLLRVDGVVGVKSGLTTEAGGCDVMAYVSVHGGLPVMIFSAVMGQIFAVDRLATAGDEALRLAKEAEVGLVPDRLAGSREKVGEFSFTTGSSAVVTATALVLPGWPGVHKDVEVTMTRVLNDGVPAGTEVGHVTVTSGAFKLRVPLITATTIPKLSWWQRLI